MPRHCSSLMPCEFAKANSVVSGTRMYRERRDLPQRIRYYQSALDVGLLKRGEFYTSLKESYVIFLCTFDPFKRGLSTYEFQMTLKGHPDVTLGDERRVMLYNIPAYKGERIGAIREVLDPETSSG